MTTAEHAAHTMEAPSSPASATGVPSGFTVTDFLLLDPGQLQIAA